MRKQKLINCLECSKEKLVDIREIKRGNGKFCSLKCVGKQNKKRLEEKYKQERKPNTHCALCNLHFLKKKSSFKYSKSKLYFCSRKCKDKAQRIESDIPQIHPPHYKNGKSVYGLIARRNNKAEKIKCLKCNYDKIPGILEVHHKDKNRENNNPNNLEILCPNCHMEEHFLTNSGPFSRKKNVHLKKDEIIKLHNEGVNVENITKILKVSKKTIKKILNL